MKLTTGLWAVNQIHRFYPGCLTLAHFPLYDNTLSSPLGSYQLYYVNSVSAELKLWGILYLII